MLLALAGSMCVGVGLPQCAFLFSLCSQTLPCIRGRSWVTERSMPLPSAGWPLLQPRVRSWAQRLPYLSVRKTIFSSALLPEAVNYRLVFAVVLVSEFSPRGLRRFPHMRGEFGQGSMVSCLFCSGSLSLRAHLCRRRGLSAAPCSALRLSCGHLV